MAKHEEPYKRYEKGDGKLSGDCGHHCGIIPTAPGHTHEGHCGCQECHNDASITNEVPTILTSPEAKTGVDPRGII